MGDNPKPDAPSNQRETRRDTRGDKTLEKADATTVGRHMKGDKWRQWETNQGRQGTDKTGDAGTPSTQGDT